MPPKGKLREGCIAYSHIPPEDLRDHHVNLLPEANVIHNKSSEDMAELPDNCIHLIVTSPPYNAGKEYEEDLYLNDYLAMLRQVWLECHRVLVNGGRLAVNCPLLVGRTVPVPLSMHVCQSVLDAGFRFRTTFIWHKGWSAGKGTAWGSWMSPSNPYTFDDSEVIHVFSKGRASRAERGKATITREDFLACTRGTWEIPAEPNRRHPAPFPLELPRRLIEFYAWRDEVVLDPFMGGGTTAVAALRTKRRFVGYEVKAEYVELANRRIAREVCSFGL